MKQMLDLLDLGRRQSQRGRDLIERGPRPEEWESAHQSQHILQARRKTLPQRSVVELRVLAQIAGELLDVPSRDLATCKHQRGGRIDDVQRVTVGPGAQRCRGTLQLLLSDSLARSRNLWGFALRLCMNIRLIGLKACAQPTGLNRLTQVRKDGVAGHGGKRLPVRLRRRNQ